ncbi:uncharacterized protein LOC34618258 [Cyclospora cayetanensis]|uniref:Uncharacterized protein LOC34618258 n=1 Tax=Cyclospora cayetanensis TaxID=88456 RepID=A0A6P6S1A1_9EIME|nr:uncharacterized protein LOC34618258 [Cyclospora cayetanensis]
MNLPPLFCLFFFASWPSLVFSVSDPGAPPPSLSSSHLRGQSDPHETHTPGVSLPPDAPNAVYNNTPSPSSSMSTEVAEDYEEMRTRAVLRAAQPPALWLHSLDSLRCAGEGSLASERESTDGPEIYEGASAAAKAATAPLSTGSSCEGPDAWRRATDGSSGVFFIAMGDSGKLSKHLEQVVARLAAVCSVVPVSFISLLGDNFYPNGISSSQDPLFSSHFEEPFNHPSLQRVAFFPILGNHDYKNSPDGQVERYYSACGSCKQQEDWNSALVRWRIPNLWYFTRFVYSDAPMDLSGSPRVANAAHIQRHQFEATPTRRAMTVVNIHVDSNILLSTLPLKEAHIKFLEDVLQSAIIEADWIFVHQHHPLFTDGSPRRNNKSFQDLLFPLYLRFGVDAVFAGHEHLLSQFELSGPEMLGGPLVQVISGAASKLHRKASYCCVKGAFPDCPDGEKACTSSNCLLQKSTPGVVLVELSVSEMKLQFVEAETGNVIRQSVHASKKAARQAFLAAQANKNAAHRGRIAAAASADAQRSAWDGEVGSAFSLVLSRLAGAVRGKQDCPFLISLRQTQTWKKGWQAGVPPQVSLGPHVVPVKATWKMQK